MIEDGGTIGGMMEDEDRGGKWINQDEGRGSGNIVGRETRERTPVGDWELERWKVGG